jgi:tRNA modification GTPase
MDLEQKLDIDELKAMIGDHPLVQTSMVEQQGIEELEQKISELFFGGQVQAQDMTYVSNSRHIALLKDAKTSINDAIQSAEDGVPIDIVQIDLIKTWELLGEVIGEEASDSLIDQLFSQFCLGK